MRIDDIVNDVEKLTLGELIDILKRVKIKILISIFISILTAGYGIYKAGQYYQLQATAITLRYPFKMSVEKEIMYKLLNNSPTDKLVCLGTLNLAENPAFPESHEGIGLTIHRINDQDDLDIQQIGLIVAQRCPIKNILPFFSNSNNLFKVAYAQSSSFNWYGHQNNRNFKEKYVDNKTVHRIYNDGWILEYKLDASGRSIPSSFIWVKKG